MDALSRIACRLITVTGLIAGAGAHFAGLAVTIVVGFTCLGVVFIFGMRG